MGPLANLNDSSQPKFHHMYLGLPVKRHHTLYVFFKSENCRGARLASYSVLHEQCLCQTFLFCHNTI